MAGQGNFGHGGRPGMRGGSAPGQPGTPEHSRNVDKHFKEAKKNGSMPYHTLTTSEGTIVSDTKKGQLHTDIEGKHSWHPDRNIAEDRKAAFETIRHGQGTAMDSKLHESLAARAKEKNGGFSVDLNNGNKEPKDGFMVAPSKSTEKIYPAKSFGPEHIAQYRTEHSKELSQKDAHLGGWNNGKGSVVLDVSKRFENEDDAHDVARKGKQDAIFDVKNGKEIKTKDAPQMALTAKEQKRFNSVDKSTPYKGPTAKEPTKQIEPGSKAFIKRFNSVSGPKFKAAKKK